jgi:hypothetical protein
MSGEAPEPGVAPEPGRREIGGRGGELGGLGPAPVVEPAPAAGEAAKPMTAKYRYVTEYRRTRMGAVTESIAICETCMRVVDPVASQLSRTGRHGTDHYEHEHPLTIVVLLQSNAGNRRHRIEGSEPRDERVREVVEMIADAWEFYRAEFGDIYRRAKALLRNLSRG